MDIIVILHNIRSNENVGSIFRTADSVLVSKIFLSGYTPAPLDRFGRKNKALMKASLGAEEFVKWEKVKNLKEAIKKVPGYQIVAVEQDRNSINYKNLKPKRKIALVFGNEVEGLKKKDLALCDLIAEIPMKGKKESLNVAVASGILLHSLVSLI